KFIQITDRRSFSRTAQAFNQNEFSCYHLHFQKKRSYGHVHRARDATWYFSRPPLAWIPTGNNRANILRVSALNFFDHKVFCIRRKSLLHALSELKPQGFVIPPGDTGL